jgi:hypothetical protein
MTGNALRDAALVPGLDLGTWQTLTRARCDDPKAAALAARFARRAA